MLAFRKEPILEDFGYTVNCAPFEKAEKVRTQAAMQHTAR